MLLERRARAGRGRRAAWPRRRRPPRAPGRGRARRPPRCAGRSRRCACPGSRGGASARRPRRSATSSGARSRPPAVSTLITSAPRSASAVVIAAGPSIETSTIRTPSSSACPRSSPSLTFRPRSGPGDLPMPGRVRPLDGRRLGARRRRRRPGPRAGRGPGSRGRGRATATAPVIAAPTSRLSASTQPTHLAQRDRRARDPGPEREAELVRELDRPRSPRPPGRARPRRARRATAASSARPMPAAPMLQLTATVHTGTDGESAAATPTIPNAMQREAEPDEEPRARAGGRSAAAPTTSRSTTASTR